MSRHLENLVKGEASLCYRLLRYLNSAAFGFASEIHSVRHALSILGEREVRRWIRLVASLGAGQDKSSDLVLAALVRARFCELLSPKIQHGDSDLFLMGMLSLMDTILEIPMRQVLDNVPIDQQCKAVLLGATSPSAALLSAHAGARIRGVGGGEGAQRPSFISAKMTFRQLTGKPCNGRAR